MRYGRDWLIRTIGCAALSLVFTNFASAQQINPYLKQRLEQIHSLESQLTPDQVQQMPSGVRNWFALANQVLDPVGAPTEDDDGGMPGGFSSIRTGTTTPAISNSQPLMSTSLPGLVSVSNSAFDYTNSRVVGFSQNDSSSAWCGSNIVTGFNSTSAELVTLMNGGSVSNLGVASSNDSGKTFADAGFITSGASFWNTNSGTPVVICTSPSTFYYAAGFGTVDENFQFLNGLGINISNDGGKTWSDPVPAILTNWQHIIDRQWIAADPAAPSHLFLAYSDFDFTRPSAGDCPGDIQVHLEVVRSMDAGKSWSQPQQLATVCREDKNTVEGVQLTVAPNGDVFAAYLRRYRDAQQILVRRSSDGGATFSPDVKIADAPMVGVENFLQGFFRNNQYPSIAVDRTSTATKGTLYVAWADGRNRSTLDMMSPTGKYNFGDILISTSSDNGATWSQPLAIDPTPSSYTGLGRDQFQPSIAVDNSGAVAVCYNDRLADPSNNAIDRVCSVSTDHAGSFVSSLKTPEAWVPSHCTELGMDYYYIGDYDTVTSDATAASGGFFTGMQVQINNDPNIYGVRF